MNNIVALLACVAAVTCNDIQVGSNNGRIIFDKKIQASPAIWRQKESVTVNTTDHEVISQVIVTDARPEKDGEAKIVEGGEGQKNVTIELQSPAVFRGFDFHVVIYAAQENVHGQQVMIKDTKVNTDTQSIDKDSVITQDTKPIVPIKNEGQIVETQKGEPSAPAKVGQENEQTRKYRNTQNEQKLVDPIVQYVNENKSIDAPTEEQKVTVQVAKTTEVLTLGQEAITPEVTTASPEKVIELIKSHPAIPASNVDAKTNDNTKTSQPEKDYSINVPQVHTKDVHTTEASSTTVHAPKEVSTTEFLTTEVTTNKASTLDVQNHESQQYFDQISKELGQKVLYGIKRN